MQSIKVEGNITVLGTNLIEEEKIVELMQSFDWYTAAIDSFPQMMQAEERNKQILQNLKELGVEEILNPNWNFFGTKERNISL